MRAILIALALPLALAACTGGPTRYAPSGDSDRGYSEMQIESDRYRVRFEAGGDVSFDQAEAYALRRAAELTLAQGGDWFIVAGRRGDGNDRNPVRTGASLGQSWGSGGFSGRSVGLGLSFDGGAGEKEVVLDILIRQGEREPIPEAYDAREVLAYSPS